MLYLFAQVTSIEDKVQAQLQHVRNSELNKVTDKEKTELKKRKLIAEV